MVALTPSSLLLPPPPSRRYALQQGLLRDAAGTGGTLDNALLQQAVAFDQSLILMKEGPFDERLYDEILESVAMAGGSLTCGASSFLASQGAGIAKVKFFRTEQGPHFSINVEYEGKSLETDQVIITSDGQTTIRETKNLPSPVNVVEIPLPNAKTAQQTQKAAIGTNTGTYNKFTNSCVTHTCDILRAGEIDAPTTTREGIRFLKSLQ